MQELEFDFLNLQEVNKDIKEYELSYLWGKFQSANLKKTTSHYTPSPLPGNKNSPGGLFSLVRRNGKSFHVIRDKFRRWQKLQFKEKGRELQIITVYSPVSNKKGPDSVYNQLRNRMVEEEDFREPLEAYFDDLVEIIDRSIEAGREIIMGGDFNDAMTVGSTRREEFLDLGLIHLNSTYNLEQVRTYKRGRQQLDHIWISASLLSVTTGFGFLPFDFGLESDHRCIYVDICIRSEPQVKNKSQRTLSSKNEKNVQSFWKYVLSQFDKHKIKMRLQLLRKF